MTATDTPKRTLREAGICGLPPPYGREQISKLNATLDPLLHGRAGLRRAYVHVDELHELGLLEELLSPSMRAILFSIMPDPVLYHCHVYEIAAHDDEPHIFADSLHGWHRDRDSVLIRGMLTHVSVFVYLTDVGAGDGAFEFVPQYPGPWLHRPRYVSVLGQAGFTFAWQRSFYHRASPNQGERRRRLFKISIQSNVFPSEGLHTPPFRRLLRRVPAGDPELDLLLGRHQGAQPQPLPNRRTPSAFRLAVAGRLEISALDFLKARWLDGRRPSQPQRRVGGTSKP